MKKVADFMKFCNLFSYFLYKNKDFISDFSFFQQEMLTLEQKILLCFQKK